MDSPTAIHKRFDDEYERLRYECGRDLEWWPKKESTLLYPVVALEGIDAVADMSPAEFVDVVAEFDWFDREDELTQE